MQMKLSSDITAQQGFTLDHGGYSKSQQEGNMKAKRYYIPPCTIRSVPVHSLPLPIAKPGLLLGSALSNKDWLILGISSFRGCH